MPPRCLNARIRGRHLLLRFVSRPGCTGERAQPSWSGRGEAHLGLDWCAARCRDAADHLLADEAALRKAMGLTDEDRLLGAIPLSHSYGFTTLVLSALVRGSTLVIPAERGPFSSLAAARELGATVFPTVPAYIQALLNLSPPPAWPSSIRLVISAGAFLSRVQRRISGDLWTTGPFVLRIERVWRHLL